MNPNLCKLLNDIKCAPLSRQARIDATIVLAEKLMRKTLKERSASERKKGEKIGKVMEDSLGRCFLTQMADLSFRSSSSQRSIDQLSELVNQLSLPHSLPESDRIKLLLLANIGHLFPNFFDRQIHKQISKALKGVLLFEPYKEQLAYFKQARENHIRVNLNHLGEAILGEDEVENRIQQYLRDLEEDTIDYISVKVSTLYSQIQLSAFDDALEKLTPQIKRLYKAAKPHQFVNLDMEEFRDLDLTVALFKRVLGEPEFHTTYAGIALQAYLPQSYEILQELTVWAKQRGSPIKVRLVKGANLPMEIITASMNNWTRAPYEHKWESDANFKRMLEFALRSENIQHVHIGIGSHNLFDIAYALVLQKENGIKSGVEFEMLSGMASSLQRVICQLTGGLTLYCPESKLEDFQHAVSYLIRRFDENGAPFHFLRHYFKLRPGNAFWKEEVQHFTKSAQQVENVSKTSRRLMPAKGSHEPPIDFTLQENRNRLAKIYTPQKYDEIPLVIGNSEYKGEKQKGIDPSTQKEIYCYNLATKQQIDLAFKTASQSAPYSSFEVFAQLLKDNRDDLLTVLIADGGKTVEEGDHEISEAIDFVTYYSQTWTTQEEPRGTLLVAPPWNFPLAIPIGGIIAALVTGNCVIFKPAPETTLIGWKIATLLWKAGVSKTTLQFLPCNTDETKTYLLLHQQLAGVILTGATKTAEHMLTVRPDLYLMAETGGKNSIIVTALADRDLAVRDIVSSAFGHSGQKCSACSLAILEKEVYEDENFLKQLIDATSSLIVGSAWDPATKVGPLIRPPNKKLLTALTSLEEEESWLLQPKQLTDTLWTPGIKLGVKSGSFFHQTECFGPVLGIMKADTLQHAIELANATDYGLTSGLHSLDHREQTLWKHTIVAGNLYINRNITGAIVNRQPFGGCKASSFGPGKKAGGPLYCSQLVHLKDQEPKEKAIIPQTILALMPDLYQLTAEEKALWKKSVESYAYWAKKYQTPVELAHIRGQENLYYLIPKDHITLRYEGEPIVDLLRVIAACLICNTPYTISSVKPLDIACVVEERCSKNDIRFVSKVYAYGKIEIPHYLREISLSFDYHRYGYVKHE